MRKACRELVVEGNCIERSCLFNYKKTGGMENVEKGCRNWHSKVKVPMRRFVELRGVVE